MASHATQDDAEPLAPAALASFRRADHVPAGYSAGWHMARTAAIATAIGGLALWLARTASLVDWLFLPGFFVVGNALEWAVHRGPMHRVMGLRILYVNHTLVHHRAFPHTNMPVAEPRELGLVMMPWYTMLGLFVVVSPVALVVAWLRGSGLAGIFYLFCAANFLYYELLHGSYHLPEATLAKLGLGSSRLFRALQSHHRHHHRLDRMAHVNFNVTLPLCDWLAGTKEREDRPPKPALGSDGHDARSSI